MTGTPIGQLSPDGMWAWDGTAWAPTGRQIDLPEVAEPPKFVSEPEVASLLGSARIDKRAAKAAAKQEAAAAKESRRADAAAQRDAKAFANSPVGRARTAYQQGDVVFQYSIDVMNQQAIVVAMIGSATSKRISDPSDVLNAVCREGWELVTGSFVFVEEGQQSRDKFMSSGQNVAIKGTTVGYYLFRRNESMRVVSTAGP